MWYQTLGLIPESERASSQNYMQRIWDLSEKDMPAIAKELKLRLIDPDTFIKDTPLERVRRLAPAVTYSKTPAYWSDPILVPRGSSIASWR
jgi:hypothetical protein